MTIVKYGIDWEVTGIERSINFVTIGIQSDGLYGIILHNILPKNTNYVQPDRSR